MAMFSLMSNDIGIDLGTASILVYIKGRGVVLRRLLGTEAVERSDPIGIELVFHVFDLLDELAAEKLRKSLCLGKSNRILMEQDGSPSA